MGIGRFYLGSSENPGVRRRLLFHLHVLPMCPDPGDCVLLCKIACENTERYKSPASFADTREAVIREGPLHHHPRFGSFQFGRMKWQV